MGPKGRSGRVRKISPHPTGIRFPDRPARSESLYRLSYPGRRKLNNAGQILLYLRRPKFDQNPFTNFQNKTVDLMLTFTHFESF